jgi:hypothetical protein
MKIVPEWNRLLDGLSDIPGPVGAVIGEQNADEANRAGKNRDEPDSESGIGFRPK